MKNSIGKSFETVPYIRMATNKKNIYFFGSSLNSTILNLNFKIHFLCVKFRYLSSSYRFCKKKTKGPWISARKSWGAAVAHIFCS